MPWINHETSHTHGPQTVIVEGGLGAGEPGPQGPAGTEGPQGPPGPPGSDGAAGAAGAQGPQGIQGSPGPQGIQGLDGNPGTPGADGSIGPTGPQGIQGIQGPPGDTGLQGPAGPQGQQGDAGPAGADSTVPGPPGNDGPQGTQGVPGADGAGVPAGVIVMWAGLVVNIPAGWLLCDGLNGTPNLTDRFIKGGLVAGVTGGATTHTHAAHTGVINHTHVQQRLPTATGAVVGFTVDTSMSGTPAATGVSTANPVGGVASLTHDTPSNEPPFYTLAFIQKT